mmetsp:Transcript_10151/g.22860  ORF Transcript_10151/g.22860 Transcript_10151/m.22860 type:complete len:201 (-) Transcript_10151:1275-1877(-)
MGLSICCYKVWPQAQPAGPAMHLQRTAKAATTRSSRRYRAGMAQGARMSMWIWLRCHTPAQTPRLCQLPMHGSQASWQVQSGALPACLPRLTAHRGRAQAQRSSTTLCRHCRTVCVQLSWRLLWRLRVSSACLCVPHRMQMMEVQSLPQGPGGRVKRSPWSPPRSLLQCRTEPTLPSQGLPRRLCLPEEQQRQQLRQLAE